MEKNNENTCNSITVTTGKDPQERLIYINLTEDQEKEMHARLLFDLDNEDVEMMREIFNELTRDLLSEEYIEKKVEEFSVENGELRNCVSILKGYQWNEEQVPYYPTASRYNIEK